MFFHNDLSTIQINRRGLVYFSLPTSEKSICIIGWILYSYFFVKKHEPGHSISRKPTKITKLLARINQYQGNYRVKLLTSIVCFQLLQVNSATDGKQVNVNKARIDWGTYIRYLCWYL